jgi:hypothetical protein
MKHQAIRNLYPNVVTIDDGAGAFDAQGNTVIIDEQAVQTEIARLTALEPARIAAENRRAAYIIRSRPIVLQSTTR